MSSCVTCTQKSSSLSLSQRWKKWKKKKRKTLPELPFHDRRQEVKAEARDCRTTADRQQRHLQRVRGIATVWCRGGCHQEGLRRPEEAGFFAQICGDLRVLAFVFYSSSFCGVDGMAFIWHSHGHDVCSIRPLGFFHAPWQRIIEPGLERITAPLKVKSLQPSSTLQFFFNSASFFFQSQVLLLLDFAEVRRWLRHTRGKNEQFAFEQPCYNLTYRPYRRLINDL